MSNLLFFSCKRNLGSNLAFFRPSCQLLIFFEAQYIQSSYQIWKSRLSSDVNAKCLIMVERNDLKMKKLVYEAVGPSTCHSEPNETLAPLTVFKKSEDDILVESLLEVKENQLFSKAGPFVTAERSPGLLYQYFRHYKQLEQHDTCKELFPVVVRPSSSEDVYKWYRKRREHQEQRQLLHAQGKLNKNPLSTYLSDKDVIGFACEVRLPRQESANWKSMVGPLKLTKKLAMQSIAHEVRACATLAYCSLL